MTANHLIIGTAGHIDHGKTELVKALTGTDTDRLAEEKKRGISIDLGFASFFLHSGLEAAVVDVPGHERFVKNMLAGSTGIDLLLLVVAVDDGVMPQTIEHLAIAELLGVAAAVVAVTKADLADAERLAEVEAQVREVLGSSPFKNAPIVKVCAPDRFGLDELVAAIESQAALVTERLLDYPPRLPIDRSFVLPGAGRVVTGTLWSGVLTTAGALELLPSGQACRPRRLEVHASPVTKALAGQRVAINLVVAGPPPRRGDFLVPPATFSLASELIAQVKVVSQAPKGLRRRARLRLYHGTKETAATLDPIGAPEIKPGERGFARIVLSEPIVAVFRDKFILRSLSPVTTVAGGTVLEAGTTGRHREISTGHLQALAAGDDRLAIAEFLKGRRLPLTGDELAAAAQLGAEAAKKAVAALAEDQAIATLGGWRRVYYMDTEVLAGCGADLKSFLTDWQTENPYQFGIQKEVAQRRLWPELSSSQADIFFDYFASTGLIIQQEGKVALAGRFPDGAALMRQEIKRRLQGFSPPDIQALAEDLDIPVPDIKALLSQLQIEGSVVRISPRIYFADAAIDEAMGRLLAFLADVGKITVSQFKDLLGTTRKYAIPLMEYFDEQKITRRVGDERVVFDPRVQEDKG